tara:strand:- start:351 stop:1793 length:1443 start_codon:yes stop_codon:yes gene_type:complete
MQKSKLGLALIPVIFLIAALFVNVKFVFKDSALDGSNQLILIFAGALTALIGLRNGTQWKQVMQGIEKSIGSTTGAILILLMIGALAGSWMLSGIVPAMIYYGLQFLSPAIFLPSSAIICAFISLATGSSWSTTATVGLALVGIGTALGISEAMVAGAVISGAYFGDKISPLSDTTNLAPAMAGTDLFTHIKYMLYTTVPSFVLALIIFTFMSFGMKESGDTSDIQIILNELDSLFYISPWLFFVPALVIFLIIKKVPALPSLLIGTLAGMLFAGIFQTEQIQNLSGSKNPGFVEYYKVLFNSLTVDVQIQAENFTLQELLSTGGMSGMLNTIWLILSAMVFGGAMEACGFLEAISKSLLSLAKGTASLIATTVGTCLFVNITASDQYLSIVIPGKMYKDAYRKKGLAPENLSRTLEDSGTVTSVLIPWNTCGAYQFGALKLDSFAFIPYAFFNIISPIMTLIFAIFNIKIRQLKEKIAT